MEKYFGVTPTIVRKFLDAKKKNRIIMGLQIEILVGNISGNKNITVTIPIGNLTFILCDSQHI